MNKCAFACLVFLMGPAIADEPSLLRSLGLDSVHAISEEEGTLIRGLSSKTATIAVSSFSVRVVEPENETTLIFQSLAFNSSSTEQVGAAANTSGAESTIVLEDSAAFSIGTFTGTISPLTFYAGGQSAAQSPLTFSFSLPSFDL